jgi:hypothetical protein
MVSPEQMVDLARYLQAGAGDPTMDDTVSAADALEQAASG